MKKIPVVLLLLTFVLSVSGTSVYALWPEQDKESKLQKDSYEKLVAKNLELRNEVDSLTKEQEQLRGIYKVLLEKVKTLQTEAAAAAADKRTIETLKKELADAKSAGGSVSDTSGFEKELEGMKADLVTQEEKSGKLADGLKSALQDKEILKKELAHAHKIIQERETVAQPDTAKQEEESGRLAAELKSALEEKKVLEKELARAHRIIQEKETVVQSDTEKQEEESGRLAAELKSALEEKETVKKESDERISQLEAELNKVNDGLKSAEEALRMQDEEKRRVEAFFEKSSLKKKYPEVFAGKGDAEKYRASSAAESVKQAVDELSAKQNARRQQVAAFDGDIEKSRASEQALKSKIESMNKKTSELKESIKGLNAEMKNANDQAQEEEGRIKELESSLERVMGEERDLEVKHQDAVKKAGQIKESLKKASAGPEKEGVVATKSEEVKALEKDLEKTGDEEKSLSDKIQDDEKKIDDLRGAVASAQARSKESAARTVSGKQDIKDMETQIAKNEAEESAMKKELQHLLKNISFLAEKRSAFKADIDEEDKKIMGLKKIVGRNMTEIEVAGESHGAPETTGFADEAEGMISMLNDEIKQLKTRNTELEKETKEARQAVKTIERESLSNKELPKELMRKVNKERLDMHYNLAVVYDKDGMYKDAEREYLKCLKIDPDDADVHYNLGILYDDKLNEDHNAANHYKKFLELRPMGDPATQVRVWLTRIELENKVGKETR